MKRFAQINSAGLVRRVIVAESAEWCEQTLGGTWVETFKDRSQRGNYAGVGYTYDETLDAFLPPKPYASWTLNEATYSWEAPVPMPDDGGRYVWVEELGDWVAVPEPTE